MAIQRYNYRRRTEQNGRGNFFRTKWGGTALVVRHDHDETVEEDGQVITINVYDKTWQEVQDALDAGVSVYLDSLSNQDQSRRSYLVEVSRPVTTPFPIAASALFVTWTGSSWENVQLNASTADAKLSMERPTGA